MKTLQEIKDEYASELGFENWEKLFYDEGFEIGDSGYDKIAIRYATECVKRSLEKAAGNTYLQYQYFIHEGEVPYIDKKQITSPDNIVLL